MCAAKWINRSISAETTCMVQDKYFALSYKTMALWRLVEDNFEVDYLIKADDDNFVRLDRLSLALTQWDEEDAGESALLSSLRPMWHHLVILPWAYSAMGSSVQVQARLGRCRPHLHRHVPACFGLWHGEAQGEMFLCLLPVTV